MMKVRLPLTVISGVTIKLSLNRSSNYSRANQTFKQFTIPYQHHLQLIAVSTTFYRQPTARFPPFSSRISFAMYLPAEANLSLQTLNAAVDYG